MQELTMVIMTWLVASAGLPAAEQLPRVELVSMATMSTIRQDRLDVHASCHDLDRTIYLGDGWSATSPADVSVLVHELVHHLQNVAGLTYPCAQARERVAYEAQDRWLELLGRNLVDEFELDPMTLLVRTRCMP